LLNLTEYIQRETECLSKLASIDKQDYITKKQYVEKLIEAERVLITEGYYPGVTIDKLATFINTKLLENNITYPRSQEYYSLFNPDKRRGIRNYFRIYGHRFTRS